MSTFRIGTLNVHSFSPSDSFESNVKKLVSILVPYNLDVLATQEARNEDNWALMCNRLSLPYSIYGAAYKNSYGNAIASRHKISQHANYMVRGKIGGDRIMTVCRFDSDHPFTRNRTFAVTHLDYIDEYERLEQIKEFSPISRNVNVLVGDMNALTRDDYSDNYFDNKIVKIRENSYWESPKFELTNQIVEKWGYEDAFRKMNPALKDEQLSTCAYGTRIDYIFLRSIPDDEWVLTECFIVNTQPATDHNAVIATFKRKPK